MTCLVAAAPSVTPWSLRRERAALRGGRGGRGVRHRGLAGGHRDGGHPDRPPWVWPRGIEWLHQCGDIAPALRAWGFSPGETAGVMGANFLRALTTIWGS